VDWDEDGRKDLILGENSGNVRIYINTNTDADPQFSGFSYLKLSGYNYDVGDHSSPYIIDWNNDGRKDVLVGETGGRVALLINTGTNANPMFSSANWIQNAGNTLDAGSTSSPVVADWNHDGKKDLLVGESNGRIYIYENIDSDANPDFDGYVKLQSDGEELSVGSYPRFEIYDWDNDGLEDILSGFNDWGATPDSGVLYFHANDRPVPDAKINGLDGPLFLPSSTTINFTVSLDPMSFSGMPADYWIFASKDSGTPFWWKYPGTWQPSAMPIRAIGFNLIMLNNFSIYSGKLPAGSYLWTFAVDAQNNTYEGTYIDTVTLNLW